MPCHFILKLVEIVIRCGDINVSCYTAMDNKKPAKPYDLQVLILRGICMNSLVEAAAGIEPV